MSRCHAPSFDDPLDDKEPCDLETSTSPIVSPKTISVIGNQAFRIVYGDPSADIQDRLRACRWAGAQLKSCAKTMIRSRVTTWTAVLFQLITTAAGSGKTGYSGDDGLAVDAELNGPMGIAVDQPGNLYIADTGNNCIRRVKRKTGMISTCVRAQDFTSAFSNASGK
jgi:hypothetical protein